MIGTRTRRMDPRERAKAERAKRNAQRRAAREKQRKKQLRATARTTPARSSVLLTLGILIVVGVIAAVLMTMGTDDEPVDGAKSITVYMIDTSGSQDLGDADAIERDRARLARLEEAARAEADRSGILVISTFADAGTGVAERRFDFSPRALECRKPRSAVCEARRDSSVATALEELATFVSTLSFDGSTDILGGAVSRAAAIGRAQQEEAEGRRLIIESDFLDTECRPLGNEISSWPPADEAGDVLQECAGESAPITDFEVVQFNGVVLTQDADLADVQRAVDAFLAYCSAVEAECEEG